jgi:hypothetical protein
VGNHSSKNSTAQGDLKMALSASVLKNLIVGQINGMSETDKKDLDVIWLKISQQIINHIQTAGVVTVAPGIAVATAGSAAAQTGATTAPGTGTIS